MRRCAATLALTVSLALLAGVAVCGASASVSALTLPEAHARAPVTTAIYDLRGRLLGSIWRDGSGGWWNGGSLECWVRKDSRGWYAGITHSEEGGAVPAGRNRWTMWAGRSFRGSATRRSSTRWDIDSKQGRLVAYTRGPDGGAAATSI